jgi:hypothetical protein
MYTANGSIANVASGATASTLKSVEFIMTSHLIGVHRAPCMEGGR